MFAVLCTDATNPMSIVQTTSGIDKKLSQRLVSRFPDSETGVRAS